MLLRVYDVNNKHINIYINDKDTVGDIRHHMCKLKGADIDTHILGVVYNTE